MLTLSFIASALVCALALISLGGGLYEYRVVDPAWIHRPEIIQPDRGGLSRRRFWIPAHILFELALLSTLAIVWGEPSIRNWLLVALISHGAMRIWSAFDFIPKALAFERVNTQEFAEGAARSWTRRSLMRLPLDLVTCGATMLALAAAAQGT